MGAAQAAVEWTMSLGPGAETLPVYPGSRHLHTVWFPYIDAEYAERIYSNASDLLGVYAYKTPNTQLGAALEYDLASRDLAGLPVVKRTTRFKLFGNETVSFVTVDGNVARDVAGHHEGTVAQANLWASAPLGTLLLSVGPGLAWGDSQYTHTFFVTGHAGLTDTHWNGFAQWQITPQYQVALMATSAHLRGDSPIIVRREQTTLTGWIAYRFK